MKRVLYFLCIMLVVVFNGCSRSTKEESLELEKTLGEVKNLRPILEEKGLYMGTAVTPGQLEMGEFVDILTNNYNYLTPENDMKWENIHPNKNVYDFKKADKIVEFAIKNNMKVRGHTLIWHQQNPYWIAKPGITPEELKEVMKTHIMEVVGHYKGKIRDWDVVNEAIGDSGVMRGNIWYLIIGEEYIEFAFRCAHEADPDARLYINDYGIEEVNPKSDTLYNLVKSLKEKGVPIYGVGFQFHLDGRFDPDYESILLNFKRFKELGLDIQITEMDVRLPKNFTQEDLERQAKIYKKVLEIFLSVGGETFIMWGLTDKYTWVPTFFSGYGAPLLFDENFKAKPAFEAVKEVFVRHKKKKK